MEAEEEEDAVPSPPEDQEAEAQVAIAQVAEYQAPIILEEAEEEAFRET
jgi:hypothetical protein